MCGSYFEIDCANDVKEIKSKSKKELFFIPLDY